MAFIELENFVAENETRFQVNAIKYLKNWGFDLSDWDLADAVTYDYESVFVKFHSGFGNKLEVVFSLLNRATDEIRGFRNDELVS